MHVADKPKLLKTALGLDEPDLARQVSCLERDADDLVCNNEEISSGEDSAQKKDVESYREVHRPSSLAVALISLGEARVVFSSHGETCTA